MPNDTSRKKPRNPVVATIKAEGRVYVRQFVDCGKKNCSRCRTPDGRAGSHGPYWYLCATRRGKWRRVYVGKNLDTGRFMLPDGRIDWQRIETRQSPVLTMAQAPVIPSATKAPSEPSTPDSQANKSIKATIARVEALERSSDSSGSEVGDPGPVPLERPSNALCSSGVDPVPFHGPG